MGSNAIRFLIAETVGDEHRIVESHRLPVRLGRAVFQTGQIPEAAMADTVDAFRRFRTSCDRRGAALRRAIATSAMRDARNRDLLVDRVREPRLAQAAATSRTPCRNSRCEARRRWRHTTIYAENGKASGTRRDRID